MPPIRAGTVQPMAATSNRIGRGKIVDAFDEDHRPKVHALAPGLSGPGTGDVRTQRPFTFLFAAGGESAVSNSHQVAPLRLAGRDLRSGSNFAAAVVVETVPGLGEGWV